MWSLKSKIRAAVLNTFWTCTRTVDVFPTLQRVESKNCESRTSKSKICELELQSLIFERGQFLKSAVRWSTPGRVTAILLPPGFAPFLPYIWWLAHGGREERFSVFLFNKNADTVHSEGFTCTGNEWLVRGGEGFRFIVHWVKPVDKSSSKSVHENTINTHNDPNMYCHH